MTDETHTPLPPSVPLTLLTVFPPDPGETECTVHREPVLTIVVSTKYSRHDEVLASVTFVTVHGETRADRKDEWGIEAIEYPDGSITRPYLDYFDSLAALLAAAPGMFEQSRQNRLARAARAEAKEAAR